MKKMKNNWWKITKLIRKKVKKYILCVVNLMGIVKLIRKNANCKYIRHNHSRIFESDVNGEIIYGYYTLI